MHRSDPIVIVGTGFAGIGMAVRLLQAGYRDVTLLEAADRLGGTWRENTYPGAACDVPSLLYSFSFAPHAWSRMFAPQEEILAYLERCVDELGVRPHIRFRCGVTRAVFDERDGMWTISTPDGERRARVLISATGAITRPAMPEIPGIERFRGKLFHSARWDHGHRLDGESVAVIGTGASAIQIVPAIAPRVRRLSVFQRTPTWILPKPDAAFTERQLALFRRAPFVQTLARGAVYSIMESLALGFVVDPRLMVPQATRARAYLREAVPDPVLRARLTPDYVIGCKRILFSSDYYPAIQRDNVDLVTEPIEAITEEGVRTRDGRVTSIDTLVLATGFHAADFSSPYTLVGRGGRSLDEAWSGGAEAYLGTTVSGFPNLFLLFGPNTALGHSSMIYMFESQIAYVMDALSSMTRHGTRTIEVRRDIQDRFNAAVQARLARSVWASGCASWYRTPTGKNTTLWPGFTFEYRYRTRRFDVESYLLTGGRPAPTPSTRLGLAAPLRQDRQRRDGASRAHPARGVCFGEACGAAIAHSAAHAPSRGGIARACRSSCASS